MLNANADRKSTINPCSGHANQDFYPHTWKEKLLFRSTQVEDPMTMDDSNRPKDWCDLP